MIQLEITSAFEETSTTRAIVSKLWNMCNILRDDGITYQNYVTELTYLLFLKMLAETGKENILPEGYRWADLEKKEGEEQLVHYKRMLLDLGAATNSAVHNPRVKAIFADAQTSLRKPTNLKALTDSIHKLDWFSAREEGLGNLYEGLLEKNAAEKKSGAGQYFTPRSLIDCIVALVQPKPGEIIQDPAAGTGGFLVAADHYIKAKTDDLFQLSEVQQQFQRVNAFVGMELVPDTHKLCLMNMMLHGIEGDVKCGDTLSPDGQELPQSDVILTNPPFGNKKGGGGPTRNDFSVTANVSSKQLAFVEHVYRSLKSGGRAALVVPDNVLFETNAGRELRRSLMSCCNLHTILRLPTGIFYAPGVKTNVMFFTKGHSEKNNTREVWVYDLRANMPQFGKKTALSQSHFFSFMNAFGNDPLGEQSSLSMRIDEGENGRFRRFSREEIERRDDNLDIAWLRDESVASGDELPEPEELAELVLGELDAAMAEIRLVLLGLGEEIEL